MFTRTCEEQNSPGMVPVARPGQSGLRAAAGFNGACGCGAMARMPTTTMRVFVQMNQLPTSPLLHRRHSARASHIRRIGWSMNSAPPRPICAVNTDVAQAARVDGWAAETGRSDAKPLRIDL